MRGLVFAAILIAAGSDALARCEGYTPQPKPQNTGREDIGQDLDAIIDQGWIEFAVYEDFAPYSWNDGAPQGVDIDIGRLIAADIGVEARFRFVAASENYEADLRNYVWKGPLIGGKVSHVMLHAPYDSELTCRVEQVVFTGQMYRESIAIAYARAAYPDEKPVPAYFRFDTVGVENDTIADFYLTSLAGGQLRANIRRFADYSAAMAALNAGQIKAVMGPRAQLEHGLSEASAIHQPPLPGFAKGAWTLGAAVRHTFRPLGYTVDGAIADALADGRIAAIFADHGLTFLPPER